MKDDRFRVLAVSRHDFSVSLQGIGLGGSLVRSSGNRVGFVRASTPNVGVEARSGKV
jgi:hypothetical protein